MVGNNLKSGELLNLPKSSFYYSSKMEKRDQKLKKKIEEVLSEFKCYGHKRIALHLKQNKKPILRVMNKYGIRPYRRRKKPWKKPNTEVDEPLLNLIKNEIVYKRSQIWVTDFTYFWWKYKWIYLATVMDRFTREILGVNVLSKHSVELVLKALQNALEKNEKPEIVHQDQGSEYTAKLFKEFCESENIKPSYSKKGSPWENAHQESFYGKFKIEIGDMNRFETLGEVVFAIHSHMHFYNHKRIHTALKMTPVEFALKNSQVILVPSKGQVP